MVEDWIIFLFSIESDNIVHLKSQSKTCSPKIVGNNHLGVYQTINFKIILKIFCDVYGQL